MLNQPMKTEKGAKSTKRSGITCPNCGHSLALFRKAIPSGPKRMRRFQNRAQLRPLFQVARGATLWFAIVFTIAAMLTGAVRQTVWPMLFGIGLLAAYGIACWSVARWAK